MTRQKIMICGESLSGTGHLTILRGLCKAYVAAGFEVHLVSATASRNAAYFEHSHFDPPEAFRLHTLPLVEIQVVGDNAHYVDAEGRVIGDSPVLSERQAQMVQLFREIQPDVLLTHQYPLSRKVFDGMFLPLLLEAHQAANRPLLVATSMETRNPDSQAAFKGSPDGAVRVLDAFYDALFVLSDPHVVNMRDTFPQLAELDIPVFHVGFVPDQPLMHSDERYGVVVSAGSAPFPEAERLHRAAIDAWKHSGALKDTPWLVLVSPALGENTLRDLQAHALLASGGAIRVEPNRPDFAALMHQNPPPLSVSLAGYGTVTSVVQAGCPAMILPSKQVEDHVRRLAPLVKMGLVTPIDPANLDQPEQFGQQMQQVAGQHQRREHHTIQADGHTLTAVLTSQLLEARTHAYPRLYAGVELYSPILGTSVSERSTGVDIMRYVEDELGVQFHDERAERLYRAVVGDEEFTTWKSIVYGTQRLTGKSDSHAFANHIREVYPWNDPVENRLHANRMLTHIMCRVGAREGYRRIADHLAAINQLEHPEVQAAIAEMRLPSSAVEALFPLFEDPSANVRDLIYEAPQATAAQALLHRARDRWQERDRKWGQDYYELQTHVPVMAGIAARVKAAQIMSEHFPNYGRGLGLGDMLNARCHGDHLQPSLQRLRDIAYASEYLNPQALDRAAERYPQLAEDLEQLRGAIDRSDGLLQNRPFLWHTELIFAIGKGRHSKWGTDYHLPMTSPLLRGHDFAAFYNPYDFNSLIATPLCAQNPDIARGRV